jgi:hypothetical protein
VALHADFELPFSGQAAGIQDGGADLRDSGAGACSGRVGCTRAMAARAIDARRQARGKHPGCFIGALARVCVVTEEAGAIDRPAEVRVAGPVVPGRHRELRTLGVPGDGQLEEAAIRRAVDEAAGVVAGANHVVDPYVHHIRFAPFETCLTPPQIDRALPAVKPVGPPRRFVVEAGDTIGEPRDILSYRREGASHAGASEAGRKRGMAPGAIGGFRGTGSDSGRKGGGCHEFVEAAHRGRLIVPGQGRLIQATE